MLTQSRLSLLLTPSVRRLGGHKELGRDTARTAEARDIPGHAVSGSGDREGERRREGRTFGVVAFVPSLLCDDVPRVA